MSASGAANLLGCERVERNLISGQNGQLIAIGGQPKTLLRGHGGRKPETEDPLAIFDAVHANLLVI